MKKKLIYGIVLLALFIACCLPHMDEPIFPQQPQTPDTLVAHFIDVGQGDSAFVQLPNGETMLIDAGANVNAYLRRLDTKKIDYLVGTHPHSDHIGALEDALRAFDIGTVVMPRVSHTSKTYEDLLLSIQEKGLKIKSARAGTMLLDTEDLDIEILAPAEDYYEDLNNYSAVIRVRYKDNAVLFTGDAEELSENQMVGNLAADVLKVGHHGSSTSTGKRFLDRVSPQIAVISCGADNDYGHPHKEVLQRLNKSNVEIYRTDEDGTIVITSDGMNLHVECEY